MKRIYIKFYTPYGQFIRRAKWYEYPLAWLRIIRSV